MKLLTSGLYGRSITTVTRAIVIAAIGVLGTFSVQPANAARHHRHHRRSDDSSQVAVSTTRHHRRHHRDDGEIADSSSPSHHRRHHRYSDEYASVPVRHHRHHGYYLASDESSQHYSRHTEIASAASTPDSDDSAGSVVDVAKRFQGARYVFGGTSRSGFDCSGFTRYVIAESAGVSLPRTAMEQFENGRRISRSGMEPGDLVFFAGTYKRGISHVGIYIGNGNFIHAANEREGVREDSLDESYYARHFAGARRVIFDREYTER